MQAAARARRVALVEWKSPESLLKALLERMHQAPDTQSLLDSAHAVIHVHFRNLSLLLQPCRTFKVLVVTLLQRNLVFQWQQFSFSLVYSFIRISLKENAASHGNVAGRISPAIPTQSKQIDK